jgi:branched-chain amino acid transport system ATP-binding protein
MLEVKNLKAWYGEAQALHDVSLEVGDGEVVTLVGRNGAGKTTLVRSLIGLHRHVEGSIVFLGKEMKGVPAHKRARAGMGWVQGDRGVYANLSVEENLLLPPAVSDRAWDLSKVYDAFPVLADRRKAPGTTLSGGEQQMLAIARVLRTGARLLLLDEPSEGLAPIVVREIGRILVTLKGEGLSILLVEQNVPLALRVADRVYVMSKGQIVYEGSPAALDANEDVKRRFLGIS